MFLECVGLLESSFEELTLSQSTTQNITEMFDNSNGIMSNVMNYQIIRGIVRFRFA
jgi:hypothetical protein